VNRNFTASSPNEALGTNMTEHSRKEGLVYACVVLVGFSRKAFVWAIGRKAETAMVTRRFSCLGSPDTQVNEGLFTPTMAPISPPASLPATLVTAGCGLRGLRAASCELRAAGCELRAANEPWHGW